MLLHVSLCQGGGSGEREEVFAKDRLNMAVVKG